eukprot:jgi/Tetstr1/423796/TSEL_014422.t1
MEPARPNASDPFYIGLTSGSTGRPKAFQRSHVSWLTSFAACEDTFGLTRADRIAVPGSLSHSLHLFGALHALHMGARLDLNRLTFPDVRRVLLSGAKWHGSGDTAADVFPAARFHEFYGTSETSFIATRAADDPPAFGRPSLSRGCDRHPRRRGPQPCAPASPGLIHVSSAMLFDGYVLGGDPDTRREGGWLSVGDQGFVDDGGRLHLLGRRSRMLVCAGVNVFAEEIEAALLRHDSVAACAVFGRPDPLRGQRIVAAIRASDGSVLPDVLRRHCQAFLDPIKVPRAFHLLEDWPLTAGGKADLVTLAQRIERLEDVA